MLRNYLLVGWRSLARDRVQSLVDIAGLSVALTSCLLILLFVRHESSYDGFVQGDGRAKVADLGTSRGIGRDK